MVVRKGAQFGRVYELEPEKKFLIGRADSNAVVFDDDLCSRFHAEIFRTSAGVWSVRDCGSRNGTKVNDALLEKDHQLQTGDEIRVGRNDLVFVTHLAELKPDNEPAIAPAGHDIVSRVLMSTRYDNGETMLPSGSENEPHHGSTVTESPQHKKIAKDLAFLYRLALSIGQATQFVELKNLILPALLESTQADGAAILAHTAQGNKREWKVIAFETPPQQPHDIIPPPMNVIKEVLGSKQAVLAVSRNRFHTVQNLQSRTVGSFILAPVKVGDSIEHLLYVYCATPLQILQQDALELSVAIGKQLAVAMQGMKRQEELQQENQRLRAQVASDVQLIGSSPAIEAILAQIGKVATTNATVLIRGESGSGKELVARAIHLASHRKSSPFICLNCAALPETLLESELFGHEKGAFTGATERKIGKFEAAHGGTIFLDEIGEMPATAQSKLLRVLEGHAYERIGGSEPVKVNVRVVAATNRPLEEAIRQNRFRQDLYYRLQVVEMRVPSLRERKDDIPILAEFFLQRFCQDIGRKITGFSPAAMEKLSKHNWPGNVRELRNVIERAVALSDGGMINADDLWLSPLTLSTGGSSEIKHHMNYRPVTMEALEKEHILSTLKHANWVKSQAAMILGIERSTLDRKMKTYEINKEGNGSETPTIN
ncbi:MAG: sigma 54-interacting transcriptional regulator [Gemmatales bacterium]